MILNRSSYLFLFHFKSLTSAAFDDFDGLVYADLDDNNYGPINYKGASIYSFVKYKNQNGNRKWAIIE